MGKVSLVGAGPGDPKLLTLRGKELLEKADTVIYDYLANPALLDFVKKEAEQTYVGKKGGLKSAEHQEKINQLMITSAQAGKVVVRLKGGDPFIFGRGGEELEALLRAEVPFEVVPGVSSAIGAPTYGGIPLTHRKISSSVTFITGHEDPAKQESYFDWQKLATGADTLVFLMAMGNLSGIIDQLTRHGKAAYTPVALIQWGTYPYQKTVVGTLETIQSLASIRKVKPPVVMVVGKVITLRDRLNWYETRPLFGKRILITRARLQAAEFIELLAGQGAETISFPTLEIIPPPTWEPLDTAIEHMASYDSLIFTSVNGVSFFRKRLKSLKKDLRLLKDVSICAIGPGTAKAIEEWDLRVDLIPKSFVAEGLLEELMKHEVKEKRFLIPRALNAREVLPDVLRKKGAIVDVVPAYQAIKPAYEDQPSTDFLREGRFDIIAFASASTLQNFIEITREKSLEACFQGSKIACIGPITAKAARRLGLNVDIVPKEYTFPALTECIIDYYRGKG